MIRLIDATKFGDDLDARGINKEPIYETIGEILHNQPTIEPTDLRGKWERGRMYGTNWFDAGYMWRCTLCEREYETKHRYCPHCGAKMEDT